jgi:DNA-directed RNA polymerase specialized sigma24 family protein
MRGSVRDAEFSEYVAGRRAQLRRTAYLLCGDVHRAEDLVQTTLMKVYVAWPRMSRDGNVDAYARGPWTSTGPYRLVQDDRLDLPE